MEENVLCCRIIYQEYCEVYNTVTYFNQLTKTNSFQNWVQKHRQTISSDQPCFIPAIPAIFNSKLLPLFNINLTTYPNDPWSTAVQANSGANK